MATKDGVADRARRRIIEDERRVRDEVGRARRGAGLSQDAVGATCGISGSAAGRIESGQTRVVDVRTLACLGAAVGLEVRLRAYPSGDPIRDAGQQRVLGRLRPRIHAGLAWRTEVVLAIGDDRRAWDVMIWGDGWRVAVEVETVLDDVQAVERRISLKQRDGGVDHVILMFADTRRNRRALAADPNSFAAFSRDARAVLGALAAGRDPGTSAILFV